MKKSKTGAQLIAEERKRQIEVEGFTVKHDLKEHAIHQLANAAICYANPSVQFAKWPFERKWFKPKNTVKDLIRAGALIAAALDLYKKRYPEEFEKSLNA